LIATVPKDKWFYTGMDTYIHCAESVTGVLNNAFSLAYANQAMQLCRDVYVGKQAGQNETNNEKLMVASLMGGLSLSYSEVGVCHALSYGLSKILNYKHCFANCVVFQHLEDIYGEYVEEFQQMLKKHNIQLPQHISNDWSDDTIHAMAEVAYHLPHMWHHAFGEEWQKAISLDFIKSLYKRL
jgi:Alcohol dehydrogenase, class IV